MYKRCILAMAALAVLVVLPPRAAAAQGITSPYEFLETSQGLYGYATYVFTDRGALETGPHSGPAVGLGYSLRISGPFVLDARFGYFPTQRTVFRVISDTIDVSTDPMADLEALGEADLSLVVIDASLRFDLTGPRTWHKLQPYALVGVGGVMRASSDNALEEELPSDVDQRVRFRNGVTGHVGAGVEWHVSRRVTIRADARDLLWKLHIPSGFIREDRILDEDTWEQSAHLSLGLGFRF